MRKVYRNAVEKLEDRKLMTGEDVVFIRGADRSGSGANDTERQEQLNDINNNSTAAGNRGWGQLRTHLTGLGYNVTQVTETVESGAPNTGGTNGVQVNLSQALAGKEIAVFGSNNAVYSRQNKEFLETWVRAGGSALFISDLKFGRDWSDAPNSDNDFTSRFGWSMNQDRAEGTATTITRAAGQFTNSTHPIFTGINSLEAEGVNPITVGAPGPNMTNTILARVPASQSVRTNTFNGQQNPTLRPSTANDAALAIAEVGGTSGGRIVSWWDRNTWNNQNGSGSDITRADNRLLATNIFAWLAKRPIQQPSGTEPIVLDKPWDGREMQIIWNQDMSGQWNGSPQVDRSRMWIERRGNPGQRLAGSRFAFGSLAPSRPDRTYIALRPTAPGGGQQWIVVFPVGSVFSSTGQSNTREIRLNFRFLDARNGNSFASTGAGTIVSGTVLPAKRTTLAGDVFGSSGKVIA
jgi:hypothetical protein